MPTTAAHLSVSTNKKTEVQRSEVCPKSYSPNVLIFAFLSTLPTLPPTISCVYLKHQMLFILGEIRNIIFKYEASFPDVFNRGSL